MFNIYKEANFIAYTDDISTFITCKNISNTIP